MRYHDHFTGRRHSAAMKARSVNRGAITYLSSCYGRNPAQGFPVIKTDDQAISEVSNTKGIFQVTKKRLLALANAEAEAEANLKRCSRK